GSTRRARRPEHHLAVSATILTIFGNLARRHRTPVGPDSRVDETSRAFGDVGTTSIEPSTDTARSSMPTCRRLMTLPPHGGSSNERLVRAGRHHRGSSPT